MNAIQNLAKRSLLLVALFVIGCLQLMAQTRTIKGEVTDAQNGEALIGATVMVEGEKGGTVTDFDSKDWERNVVSPSRCPGTVRVTIKSFIG